MSKPSNPAPRSNFRSGIVEDLDSRMAALEVKVEGIEVALGKFEQSHDQIKSHISDFQINVSRMTDSVDRLKTMEVDLRLLREKLISYESKFQAIDQLKGMVITVLLGLFPGAVMACIELFKFVMSLR